MSLSGGGHLEASKSRPTLKDFVLPAQHSIDQSRALSKLYQGHLGSLVTFDAASADTVQKVERADVDSEVEGRSPVSSSPSTSDSVSMFPNLKECTFNGSSATPFGYDHRVSDHVNDGCDCEIIVKRTFIEVIQKPEHVIRRSLSESALNLEHTHFNSEEDITRPPKFARNLSGASDQDSADVLSDTSEDKLHTLDVSVGSAMHSVGKCRPCAWFWKPEGCLNGSSCRHCHLCSPEELRERKKKHKILKSQLKRQTQQSEPQDWAPCAQASQEQNQMNLQIQRQIIYMPVVVTTLSPTQVD
jgi:hypothetical protein